MEFEILTDNSSQDKSLPAFMVSTTRGFLPRIEPPTVLPHEFDALENILREMPIRKASGEPGLLATRKLGETVDESFPNLVEEVEKYKGDQIILNALYRDYSFLLSAYLFEPCYDTYLRTEGKEYGLGRHFLPKSIAQPMAKVAELTGFKPFMEYAGSYALYNYKLLDQSRGMEYDNLALIRAFEYGLDNKKILESLKKINSVMDEMWQKSKPDQYSQFRIFIFGIQSQPMFPDGVIYEGVSSEPMRFRGESGANDSMIPLVDNFMCIDMPDNPLTHILKDFRQYRPGNHKAFLTWVETIARGGEHYPNVKEFALGDQRSAVLYLLILDQIREFRGRHWNFTREYILKQGKRLHPRATGGSPIVEWLPNQLTHVLNLMSEVQAHIANTYGAGSLKGQDATEFERIQETVPRQLETLQKEVNRYSANLASQ
ncbi:hypothetical protein ABW20_dc0108658 [Dactylellina cionopaga]|nr:hypothetical protein ABW20_dc0108658 [Dactylellina cionopaga]